MNAQERSQYFNELVTTVQQYGQAHSSLGYSILGDLWEIMHLSLWQTESWNDNRYESFVEFCEDVLQPAYEDPDYFRDFMNVTDRVFKYVHMRFYDDKPIMNIKTGKPVTVHAMESEDTFALLEQKRWVGKLISISQHIGLCRNDTEIDALFNAAIIGTREDVQTVGATIQETHIPIRILVIERINADGSSNFTIDDLDKEQRGYIMKKLGKAVDLHFA